MRPSATRSGFAALILSAAAAMPHAAAAAAIEFLVAELPGHEVYGDSYVLLLDEPAHIAHARELILKGPAAGATIAAVRIAAGPDGRNRRHRDPSQHYLAHISRRISLVAQSVCDETDHRSFSVQDGEHE